MPDPSFDPTAPPTLSDSVLSAKKLEASSQTLAHPTARQPESADRTETAPETRGPSPSPSGDRTEAVTPNDVRSPSNSGSVTLRQLPDEARPPLAKAGPVQRLGRYEVLVEIGRGGMGSVLRGHDPELNRDLAIKVLLDRHRGSGDVETRFREEAQIGGQLQHPGIVPVYEMHRGPDGLFFAMKLVHGRTLGEKLRAARRPPTTCRCFS